MASVAKKIRTREDAASGASTIPCNVLELVHAIDPLLSDNIEINVQLIPLKFKNCNATTAKGAQFSKAFCDAQKMSEGFVFADIFRRGIELLGDYLDDSKLPESKAERLILNKLLDFMEADKGIQANPKELSEKDLAIVMANHLFGKLAASPLYVVDERCDSKTDACSCGQMNCKITGQYGDTSIGNIKVWHGNLDIIINNDVVVKVNKEDYCIPGEKSSVESELKPSVDLFENSQIIAQTIVFSFLQKQTHPELENFLIPCIGIAHTDMIITLYDSEHDVFFESSKLPIFKKSRPLEFNPVAVVVSWLTVNYKFLCTGLTEKMKNVCKADFFIHAQEKIEVYQNKLKYGNVTGVFSPEEFCLHSVDNNHHLNKYRRKFFDAAQRERDRIASGLT